jgi:hypothetical protein
MVDFDLNVDRSGGPDACWPWIGYFSTTGYGAFKRGGKHVLAHRESVVRAGVNLRPGDWVLHRCDNRRCVNPAHLYVGGVKENVKDMWERGKPFTPETRGEDNPAAKLTEEQVAEMLELRRRGESVSAIAKRFKVSYGHAGNILRGAKWRHVSREPAG